MFKQFVNKFHPHNLKSKISKKLWLLRIAISKIIYKHACRCYSAWRFLLSFTNSRFQSFVLSDIKVMPDSNLDLQVLLSGAIC